MKKRILAVEDSPTQGEMLRYALEVNGFEARLEVNGKAALAALDEFLPDAVITDILMPEMDGYQLCRAIKSDPNRKHLPVILVTGLSDPVEVIRGLECGAEGFIVKPYSRETLVRRVQKIIEDAATEDRELPAEEFELEFQGKTFSIGSSRRQILNLLLSSYETAVEKNEELRRAQDDLRQLNESLEVKVSERTTALEEEVGERRKAEARLTELNEALEQRAGQLRQLAMALTRTEQEERQRLASILHDHLQQLLVAAQMVVGSQKERGNAPDHHEKMERIESLLSEAIDASRNLTVELCPPVLREGGLVSGFEWLGRRMRDQYGLQVETDLARDIEGCPEEIATFAFQAARELLFNVVKHAGVEEAELSLELDGDSLRVVVRDRGKGFDPVARNREGGASFGLFSLEERIQVMGGRAEIQSAPGEGTVVTLALPLKIPISAGNGGGGA